MNDYFWEQLDLFKDPQHGHVYEIQKVTDVRRAASLKAGGAGIRYTCIVDGKESHLFYEDNNMWFMEER